MTPAPAADPAPQRHPRLGEPDSPPHPEEQLREALETLAGQVHAAPGAYHQARAGWHRRERRRKLILAILIALVFAAADLIGLWALNKAQDGTHIIFNDPTPTHSTPQPPPSPARQLGPP